MDPGSLAMAGSSLMSSLITNAANSGQAASNRAFQAEMSGTAHQGEVADLRAAGLNPILSATGGSGASTPAGAQAEMQDAGNTALARYMERESQKKALEKTDADIGVQLANKSYTSAQEAFLGTQKQYLGVQMQGIKKEMELKGTTIKQIQATLPKLMAEGKYAEANQVLGMINSASSSAQNIFSILPGLGELIKNSPLFKKDKAPIGLGNP